MNFKTPKKPFFSNSFLFFSYRFQYDLAITRSRGDFFHRGEKGILVTLPNDTNELTAVPFQISYHPHLVNFIYKSPPPLPRSLLPTPLRGISSKLQEPTGCVAYVTINERKRSRGKQPLKIVHVVMRSHIVWSPAL